MPSQPNNQVNTAITPLTVQDAQQQVNNGVGQQRVHANQPWSLRVYQTSVQSIPYNTITSLGFDTISYNTYQAISSPVYRLSYDAILGYPYTGITCPQLGYYDLRASVSFNNTPGGTSTLLLGIFLNGSLNSYFYGNHPQPSGTTEEHVEHSDIIFCNPGDQISWVVLQTTSAGGNPALSTYAGSNITYSVTRYLGLN